MSHGIFDYNIMSSVALIILDDLAVQYCQAKCLLNAWTYIMNASCSILESQ